MAKKQFDPPRENAYQESEEMNPQFVQAIKDVENYLGGKGDDSKKAMEAGKVIEKYSKTFAKEVRFKKKKLMEEGVKVPSLNSIISAGKFYL